MRRCPVILLLLLALSCNRKGSADILSVEDVITQPVQLAVGVGSSSALTKGDPAVLTEMQSTFRGMDQVYLLPFSIRGASGAEVISADDQSLYHMTLLPGIREDAGGQLWHDAAVSAEGIFLPGVVYNNAAHLYPNSQVILPRSTASVLVYGRSPARSSLGEVELKHRYGALNPVGFGTMSTLRKASDLGFEPEQIRTDIPPEGQTLADILNSVVKDATYTAPYYYKLENESIKDDGSISLTWNESVADARLQEWFLWITNRDKLMPGSGPAVEYLLHSLRLLLTDYAYYDLQSTVRHSDGDKVYQAYSDVACQTPLMMSDVYNGLRDLLLARLSALTQPDGDSPAPMELSEGNLRFRQAALRKYPENYGLPEGSAVVRWDGVRYSPVGASLEGVAPMSAYCYPPRLWYYANTSISTLDAPAQDLYQKGNSWESIVASYTAGNVVYATTESVVLNSKMHFSCGMLLLTVRSSRSVLDDGDGLPATTVTLGQDSFPLTGVIVGGQRRLAFDFTPVSGAPEYFLYDNQPAPAYLVQAAGKEGLTQVRSFVSQTLEGKDVYLCLEFRNDSGKSFVGADGVVNPGARFYLLGNLPYQDASVFRKDFTTEVNCVVPSLAEAHCAIPDLENPRLSIGLETETNWIQSTSSSLVLY